MITVPFKNKGGDSGDRTPSLNVSDLVKAGLLSKKEKLKQGDLFTLKIVNSGNIVAEADFRVNRKTADTMKAEGWNDYLFPLPKNGKDLNLGVCAFSRAGLVKSPTAGYAADDDRSMQNAAKGSRPTSLSAIKKLLAAFPTKVAAAASIGVSVDTLRRMINKATAEAAVADDLRRKNKKSAAVKQAAASTKKPENIKRMPPPKSYGKTGITLKDLKSALKQGTSNAALTLDVSVDTIRRAKKFFGL